MKSYVSGRVVIVEEVNLDEVPPVQYAIRDLLREDAIRASVQPGDHIVLFPQRGMEPIEVKISFDRLFDRYRGLDRP